MTFLVRLLRCAPMGVLGLVLAGCLPQAQSQMEEEREPYFQAGKNHVNTMDYTAAIESFEKALDLNPKSAAAHFQLACLFDQMQPDPVEAVHHYQQFLKLRPNSDRAEQVKQRIVACKQELARTVSWGPMTEKQQRDLEKLAEDNKRLTEENHRLTDEIGKWRAYAAAVSATPTNPTPERADRSRVSIPPQTRSPGDPHDSSSAPSQQLRGSGPASRLALGGSPNRSGTSPAGRTHLVRRGETSASIARQAGVSLDALSAANPRLVLSRIRAGQTLNLPPR